MLALLSLSGLVACSSTPEVQEAPPAPGIGAAVDRAAFELASKAAQRVEVSTLRVALHGVEDVDGVGDSPLPSRFASSDLSVLTEEVAGEMTIALASNFHLIDRELMEPLIESWREDGLSAPELVEKTGATHVVVGTVSPRDDAVQLNLRLVDAKNYVIVSTARVDLPVDGLSDRSRVALGDILSPRTRDRMPSHYEDRTRPPEPVPLTDDGLAAADRLVEEGSSVETTRRAMESAAPAGYSYTPSSRRISRTKRTVDPARPGPAAARFAAAGRRLGD
jgi:FlgO protein